MAKPNPLPSSVKDRLTNLHEHLFHLVRSPSYYYNLDAIREPHTSIADLRRLSSAGGIGKVRFLYPGKRSEYYLPRGRTQTAFKSAHSRVKNPGDVWRIPTIPFKGAHFSVYPEQLCRKPILSSCPEQVCGKCGSPNREVIYPPSSGAFNIRVRDARKGVLHQKWGAKYSASSDEVAGYHERSYRRRSRVHVVAAGCNCGIGYVPGTVIDPFAGSGTTLKVAKELGRRSIGIEINYRYATLARKRVGDDLVVRRRRH